jgi:asparagine N-glycosylation enzyme membrane subunit Stt3
MVSEKILAFVRRLPALADRYFLFWEKHRKTYPFFILPLAIAIGFNLYFRFFPVNFPQFKVQAEGMVNQAIHQQVRQEIYSKFPQYSSLAMDGLIKNRIAEFKATRKGEIRNNVRRLYLQLKDRYQDAKGQTYLMELDCWHWSRYVENVLRLGHPGDEIVNGKQLDTFMLAPSGMFMLWDNFLYYFSAFLYRVFALFNPIPLRTFLFYLPLLFMAILTAVLYFFTYRHGGHIGAIIASLLVGSAPMFIPRSCVGWFDKDILNLVFPLLVVWTYSLAQANTFFKPRALWIFFSSFWVGLFCFTWNSWWFIFVIIIFYEAVSIAYVMYLYIALKEKNGASFKKHLFSLSLFILFIFLWILIFCGRQPLEYLYKQITLALILNKPLMTTIWPNVYSTVGELKGLDLREIYSAAGGVWLFVPAVLYLLVNLIRVFVDRNFTGFKRESTLILSIWFVSMLFATSRGVRFIVFLLIPLGISLGWLINDAYQFLKARLRAWVPFVGLVLVLLILARVFTDRAYKSASSIFPLMNDTWYKVLTITKESTPKEAILNSWWDFGDWFKVVAGRRVIFDGQSQDTPQAYWMANVLLADNEEAAMRLLRMLNNGGNKAFEIIDEYIKEPLKSVLLLESVLDADPEKAKTALLEFLPVSAASEVLKIIFLRPAPAYFIVDPSLPFKMGAISYLGNWNFSKAYIAQNLNRKEKEEVTGYLVKLGKDPKEVERFYQEAGLISRRDLDSWLSYPVQFYSGLIRGQLREDAVYFENGFLYKPKEQTIYTNSAQVPRSLFIAKDDNLVEVAYTNANVNYSVLVYQAKDNYYAVMLDRQLAGSLFVRLYFLDGKGLRYFKPFVEAEEGSEFTRAFAIFW